MAQKSTLNGKEEVAKITTVAGRKKLKPRREPYWERDGEAFVGFRCTGEDGEGSWIGRIRQDGKQHYNALGRFDDYRDAVKALRTWLIEREQNQRAGVTEVGLTVADACRKYLEWVRQTKGGGRALACPLNILEASVTGRPAAKRKTAIDPHPIAAVKLSNLSKPDFKAWRDGLIEGNEVDAPRPARATASRHFKQFVAVLNHAHREQLVAKNEAWKGVEDFSNYVARANESHRYLSTAERRFLFDAADPRVLDFLELMALTGARPIELQRLTASDYDPVTKELTLWSYKGAKRIQRKRHIPVDSLPGVTAIVKRLVKGKLPLTPLFDQTQEFWIVPTKEAARKAGLPDDVTAYSLRHSFITDALRAGVPIHSVAQICGTSINMIEKTYSKVLPDHVKEAFGRMAAI